MEFLKGVWKFINSKIFGYIIIVVIAIFLVGTCGRNSSMKEEAARKDQNISALNDTIQTVTLKNGELQASKSAYISTINDLFDYNEDLYNDFKDQDGDIITLNRIIFKLKQDSTDLAKFIASLPEPEPEQVNDSTWNIPWRLAYVYDSTNYDIFKGTTQIGLRGPKNYFRDVTVFHNQTWMTDRDSQIKLTWGQKYDKDGRLKVFAQTAHPAFQTQLLDGTYVDFPKKRRWFTGLGIGPQFGVGYDFLHNQPTFTIGLGIQYNIYQW